MSVLVAYWDFITRLPVERNLPTLVDRVPNFFFHTMCWTGVFLVVQASTSLISTKLYPNWYNGLDAKKKSELPPYIASIVHHFTVVPFAWYCIYNDFISDPVNTFDFNSFCRFAGPFCVAYTLADTFMYAIPICFRGNFEYIVHHALAFWMLYALLSCSGHLVRYFPHLIICETANGLFNLAWVLRLAGMRDTLFVAALEIGFTVLFFFLRVINLTVVFYLLFTSPDGNFGVGKYVFPLISFLQFYWQFKIFQALAKKFLPGSQGGGAGGGEGMRSSVRSATTSKVGKKAE